MAKIALCILVGTEGFGNVSVDKEVGCLEKYAVRSEYAGTEKEFTGT